MAGVIRKEQFASVPAFSFEDFGRRALKIVEAAHAEAAALKATAKRAAAVEIAKLRERAHAEGHSEGHAQGLRQAREAARESARREARAETQRLSAMLAAALREFEQCKHRVLADAESGLIRLAIAIARRVCKCAVALSSDAAIANVRHLLELVRHDHDVTLSVHPDEWELLRAAAQEFVEGCDRLEHVEVVPDKSMPSGGCRIRTTDSEINADIDVQLQRVAAALLPDDAAAEATS